MDILRIVLEVIFLALAAAYQYAGLIVLHKVAASYHFQHQYFQPCSEVVHYLMDVFVQRRLWEVALHTLKHPDDILLTQVIGKLRLEVETAEAGHKRITLHDGLRLFAKLLLLMSMNPPSGLSSRR